MNYLDFLNARVSVRNFDSDYVIDASIIKEIVKNAANAPSSNNFQPWKVIAIVNKEKQAKLREFAFGQRQVETASVVFVIFGDLELYNVDKIMNFNLNKGIINLSDLESKSHRVQAYLKMHPEDASIEGLKFDLGLFSMNLMHAVRAFGYDSVPMRGVDFKSVMDYLNIPNHYEPMLLLPVGKASKAGNPHIRYELSEFFQIIT
ncbi:MULTISPECIES: nitroreductase family protein [unclassified Enterococcus]|uniref:nitroreductase family protein n=1 Tax=unclassified Enterococcus TaxID=2608891 RepID=UPI001551FFFF|nr:MULTISPECIES: nitroreductase family protein [unclassified Enterococcus]MBS7578012.1 nitroreductase family protein [Enterococcus sp. MMGLQ5-2]MBS7585298.1 nitroreductase family protein [Enterococcus sp. MMGLQ5-1]NPD13155.1 nitroreductase family protein [Enterococcus sp. MMGLQ5-1]NPD37843.1 nitroreductase family protein [Enterococcus sp. MMGLQ5-2]